MLSADIIWLLIAVCDGECHSVHTATVAKLITLSSEQKQFEKSLRGTQRCIDLTTVESAWDSDPLERNEKCIYKEPATTSVADMKTVIKHLRKFCYRCQKSALNIWAEKKSILGIDR